MMLEYQNWDNRKDYSWLKLDTTLYVEDLLDIKCGDLILYDSNPLAMLRCQNMIEERGLH